MNIAEPLGLYLALWKSLGKIGEVPFPGTEESYKHVHSNASQDIVARFTIYASLQPQSTAGKRFNVADVDYPVPWSMVWPGIAAYFGLNCVSPLPSGQKEVGENWVRSQKEHWDNWMKENGLREKVLDKTSCEFMTIVVGVFSEFDRNYDLSEARRIGFIESVDPVEGYKIAFDRMRAANILPQ